MSHPMHNPSGFPHQPPQASSSTGSTVIKVLLIVFAVLGACCVCCGVALFFMYSAGAKEMERQAAVQASTNQQVRDNLGELEPADVKFDLLRSTAAEEELRKSCFVFQAKGPLGEAELVFEKIGANQVGRLLRIRIVDGEEIIVE